MRLTTIVKEDPSYHGSTPMKLDEEGKYQLADGAYDLAAYGTDTGQEDEEGNNTFYLNAIDEIMAQVHKGSRGGVTKNGVEWSLEAERWIEESHIHTARAQADMDWTEEGLGKESNPYDEEASPEEFLAYNVRMDEINPPPRKPFAASAAMK